MYLYSMSERIGLEMQAPTHRQPKMTYICGAQRAKWLCQDLDRRAGVGPTKSY